MYAGFKRERASSGGIPQAEKSTVDLKQKKKTEKQRDSSRAFGRLGALGSPTDQCSKKRLAPIDYRNRSYFGLDLDQPPVFFPLFR